MEFLFCVCSVCMHVYVSMCDILQNHFLNWCQAGCSGPSEGLLEHDSSCD